MYVQLMFYEHSNLYLSSFLAPGTMNISENMSQLPVTMTDHPSQLNKLLFQTAFHHPN